MVPRPGSLSTSMVPPWASMIAFARGTGAEVISLEVRSDNDRAKALYRKFGFTSFGVFRKFFKLGEAYFDADYMNLYL